MTSVNLTDERFADMLVSARQELFTKPWGTIEEIATHYGVLGVTYSIDEDGDEYATIGYNLPEGVMAEVEDGTYGSLQGFRVYRLPEDVATVEAKARTLFPEASAAEDNDGQIVIYTGLTTDEDGNVILVVD